MQKSVVLKWKYGNVAEITFSNDLVGDINTGKLYRNIDMPHSRSPNIPVGTQKMIQFCNAMYNSVFGHNIMVDHSGSTAYHHKVFRKFSDDLGITPKRLLLLIRGFIYETKITHVEKWVERLARGHGKGRYKWDVVDQLVENKAAIDQFEKDGQEHLVPILILYVVTTKSSYLTTAKDVKEWAGKGVWKWCCANSMTKNCLVFKNAKPHFNEFVSKNLSVFKTLPSGVLKYWPEFVRRCHEFDNEKAIREIIKQYPLRSGNSRLAIRDINIVADTMQMSEQLNLNVNFNKLSLKRVKELHNEYSERIALQKDKQSMTPIDWIHNDYANALTGDVGHGKVEYKWKILDTKLAIKQEGKQMRHCVGMYGDRVFQGHYMVVSLMDADENKLSTIGLYRSEIINGWKVQQHYAHCNKEPSVACKAVCQIVVGEINKCALGEIEQMEGEVA